MPSSGAYAGFVRELKQRVASARLTAGRSVSRELVLLYWDIGRAIAEKQRALGWGEAVVEVLARDLRDAFPGMGGFSADNLWRMRKFYAEYSNPAFLEQLVPEMPAIRRGATKPSLSRPVPAVAGSEMLAGFVRDVLSAVPWGHHLGIIKKGASPAVRIYYLRSVARFGWSRKVLLNQIMAGVYERSLRKGKSHNFTAALPEHLAEQAEEALKSSYNLEFLGIGRAVKERELEARLVGRVRDFILELGYGFCFVGQQHRLALGTKEYFVDLLFYHRFLKALIAIDLKIGAFESEFTGKMDFYLNLLNDRERAPDDRPSIGIILCAEKDNLEVEYALRTKGNPIGVAAYRLQSSLPAELRGKLPTARQLTDVVRRILPGS